jgi:nitroimidazol reductase NimA-like FMN-containing flavoprotein (pyridoxamine 5'-phosphate oxidase superfamily)
MRTRDGEAMKTEPRRKERAMKTYEEMEGLLGRAAVGHLAMTTPDGPYVVPMNYLFAEGCIYLHSAPKGRKVESLRTDPRVCFTVEEAGPQVKFDRGCGISQIYESVMCFGRAEFVERLKEKGRILEMMVRRFLPPDSSLDLPDGNVESTAVIRIRVEWMTGKANRISPVHTVIPARLKGPG